jgi:hypothetical protein
MHSERSRTEATLRKLAARRKVAARLRRHGYLRRRVVTLSLTLFALSWMIVFGQMALGHDPVLGSKTRSKAAKKSGGGGSTQAQSSTPSTAPPVYYLDPATGQIYESPSTGSPDPSATVPAPATSAPAPVISSPS